MSRLRMNAWIFILVLQCSGTILGQTADYRDFRIIELRGLSGHHLYTGETLHETLANGYRAVKLRYGWQSSDPDGWQSMYLYPASLKYSSKTHSRFCPFDPQKCPSYST